MMKGVRVGCEWIVLIWFLKFQRSSIYDDDWFCFSLRIVCWWSKLQSHFKHKESDWLFSYKWWMDGYYFWATFTSQASRPARTHCASSCCLSHLSVTTVTNKISSVFLIIPWKNVGIKSKFKHIPEMFYKLKFNSKLNIGCFLVAGIQQDFSRNSCWNKTAQISGVKIFEFWKNVIK